MKTRTIEDFIKFHLGSSIVDDIRKNGSDYQRKKLKYKIRYKIEADETGRRKWN